MAKRVQFRRGTSTQHSNFTGALGEVTVDTTLKTLRVHDNVKVGGNIIATQDYVNNTAVKLRSTNITVEVGVGQTYTTINQALEYLSGFYPMYKNGGVTATINLKAGFVMAEQVDIRSVDMSFIEIKSEDTVVYVNTSEMTKVFYTDTPDRYMFLVRDGGKGPKICVQFERTGDGSNAAAFVVANGSELAFSPRSGARGFKIGLRIHNSSRAFLDMSDLPLVAPTDASYGVDFSNCDRGINVYHLSSADFPVSRFNNCNSAGAFVIWNSRGNFYKSEAINAGQYGFGVRGASALACRESNVSGSDVGYYAIQGATLDARAHATDGTGGGGYADNCRIAMHCGAASAINVQALSAKNCTHSAIRTYGSARVSADGIDFSGSRLGVDAGGGGSVISITESTGNDLTYGLWVSSSTDVIDMRGIVSASNNNSDNLGYSKDSLCINISESNISGLNTIRVEGTEMKANHASIKCGGITTFRGAKTSIRGGRITKNVPSDGGIILDNFFSVLDGSILVISNYINQGEEAITCNLISHGISRHGVVFGEI